MPAIEKTSTKAVWSIGNEYRLGSRMHAAAPAVVAAARKLAAEAASMTYAAPPDRPTRVKLWFYALSLRLQMFLRGRRHRKYAQLERRWRTVKCLPTSCG